MNRVRLDDTQASYIREHYKDTLNKDIAAAVGLNHPKMVTFALQQLGLKRTKEEVKALMKRADNPKTVKFAFSPEQEQYLRDNAATKTNAEIAEALGFKKSFIKDKVRELGIVRTETQTKSLISRTNLAKDHKKIAAQRLKIEGGGRDAKCKTKWHLKKWQTINGELKPKQVLVYRTGDFDNFEDLMVITRSKFANFVRIRDKKKEIAKRKAEKDKAKLLKQKPKRVTHSVESIERRKESAAAREKFEEFKKNYKPKTIAQAQEELVNEGKVPVKLDHKTTIWVKREKCVRLENGNWVKKSSLSNENTYGNKNERADTGATEGIESRSYEASQPENEIYGGEGEAGEEVGGGADHRELSHF